MKDNVIYQNTLKHLNDLKTNLENQDQKKHLEIIEYLINFLGCFTLSILLKTIKSKELSKGINISDLSANEWQKNIEKWIAEYSSNKNIKGILSIKREFIQEGDDFKLHDYIYRWRRLRNEIEHDMPLISGNQLTDYLVKKYFRPQANLDSFIQSLLKIIKENPNTLKSKLFYLQNDTIYIYKSIEENDTIKYIHYNLEPIKRSVDNFPLSYDKIFLSLSPTSKCILAEEDVIRVKMKTTNSRKTYENDFELWMNNQLIAKLHQSYVDGDHISFPLKDIKFEDGQRNNIEVKALRYGKVQSDDSKLIEIYSKVPDINISWKGKEGKQIPIGKFTRIPLSLYSVFEVQNIEIESIECSEYIVLLSEKPPIAKVQDTLYETNFDVMSTHIGKASLALKISYTDRRGEKRYKSVNMQIVCTPNFFEPDFEGEEREEIISKMLSKRSNYLITGEGGIGKSRLIKEYSDRIRSKPYAIKISSFEGLASLFADKIGIPFEKRDKYEDKSCKIIEWFREEAMTAKLMDFWISDCHEITNDKDLLLLRDIAQICSDTGNNIMLILESRDESWSDSVKNLFDKLNQTDITITRLKRLEKEEQMKIIDSILAPNKFDLNLKNTLIKQSDGIIYCLLEFMKSLNDKNVFVFEDGQIWSHKPVAELTDLLDDLSCRVVRQTGVDNCLKELDAHGLGEKGRAVLRYLCFGSIPINVLKDLLECDIQAFEHILDSLEGDYIIKCTEDVYEFHHQLKRDYFFERFFPSYMWPDYYADIRTMYSDYIELTSDDMNELYPFVGSFDEESGDHLKEEYKQLSEPRLREKVKWLLHMASEDSSRNAMVEILYNYANILREEDILNALEELLFDGYGIELDGEMETLHTVNFHFLRKQIEQIFQMKKMDDFIQYHDDYYKRLYYNINIRIEIEELLLTFHEKYNIIDFDNYPRFAELSIPIFNLTDIFLNNHHFLLETYKILENIYLYFEYAKECDAPERYLSLHDDIDIYKSFIHLLALIILTAQEKKDEYAEQYLLFLNKLVRFMPQEITSNSETTEFAEFHKNFAFKQYPKVAEIISDIISALPHRE